MKKLFISLMIVSLILVPTSGVVAAANGQSPAAAVTTTISVPANTISFDAAVPAVDSLVMCMLERGYSYRPNSEEFFWAALYYMLGIYGEADSRAVLTDGTLTLPAETVRDYAASLFTDYTGLPAIPAELSDSITYDPDADTYVLARGDAGLTQTVLGGYVACGDDSYLISGSLVSLADGTVLCNFEAILTASEGMFSYTTTDLLIL